MPPKKPPTQAGKFKPLKRPVARKSSEGGAAAGGGGATPIGSSAAASSEGGRDRSKSPGGPSRGSGGRGEGRGDGRGSGRGGRGGRGGGRGRGGRDGRGRGGRFIVPTGAAFFTGAMAKGQGAGAGGEGGMASLAAGGAAALLAGAGGGGAGLGGGGMEAVKMEPGRDGSVIMPGMMGSTGGGGASSMGRNSFGGGGGGMGGGKVSKNVAESMAAAARARLGEGEEIVVAEMELEPGEEDADDGKKKSVLDGPSSSGRFDGMPSLFDNENEGTADASEGMNDAAIADAFVYDSDSSLEEERRKRRIIAGSKKGSGRDHHLGISPAQLPFPVSKQQQPMYSCQEEDEVLKVKTKNEEEKKSQEDMNITQSSNNNKTQSSKLSDPPLQSPFLDLTSVTDEVKRIETYSWYLMRFPTRLPHLDVSSSLSSMAASSSAAGVGAKKKNANTSAEGDGGDDDDDYDEFGRDGMTIKNELDQDGLELVGSSGVDNTAAGASGGATGAGGDGAAAGTSSARANNNALTSSSAGAGAGGGATAAVTTMGSVGYDNTLKDIAPGRYGRIVVRKSGRTELIVGGEGDGRPEVRMLIHEGLQCGFRQEAVAIDPEEAKFVSLGDVTKSLIVTPDVEKAFVFS